MTEPELCRWVGDPAAFRRDRWRRAPGLLHPASPPAPPLTLADVDVALASGLLRVPYVEMARAGGGVPESSYTKKNRAVGDTPVPGVIDPAGVARGLRAGATLLLRNVEHWHGPTRSLVDRLEEETGRLVEAFFFVTPPGHRGLDVHRDDADVLLLQIAGAKRWEVYGGPCDGEWQPGPAPEPGPVCWEGTVDTGEVLYIPRGFAHAATGQRELSVHLSLTVREAGAAQLCRTLQRTLVRDVRLPARPLDEEGLRAEAEELIGVFRQRLAALTPAGLVDAARAEQRGVTIPSAAAQPPGATPQLSALASEFADLEAE